MAIKVRHPNNRYSRGFLCFTLKNIFYVFHDSGCDNRITVSGVSAYSKQNEDLQVTRLHVDRFKVGSINCIPE